MTRLTLATLLQEPDLDQVHYDDLSYALLREELLDDLRCIAPDVEAEVLCIGGCGAWVPEDEDLCYTCNTEYSGKHDFHREALRRLS